eukprot:1159195-Pelagomonas_calceolata.AAC.5
MQSLSIQAWTIIVCSVSLLHRGHANRLQLGSAAIATIAHPKQSESVADYVAQSPVTTTTTTTQSVKYSAGCMHV